MHKSALQAEKVSRVVFVGRFDSMRIEARVKKMELNLEPPPPFKNPGYSQKSIVCKDKTAYDEIKPIFFVKITINVLNLSANTEVPSCSPRPPPTGI